MISTLVLTYQEENNLPRCLQALAWCDDVVVLDSFSTDRTVDIARAYGARVIQRAFDTFADQRNYGLAHGGLRHEWVLHIDADEIVSPELRDEILGVIRGEGSIDGFRIPSRTMLNGVWLKHAGMYPVYQVRLGRRDRLRFQQVGHGQRETLPAERIGTLRSALDHYSFSKGLTDWFEKHNRYSTAEAEHALAAESDASRALPRLSDLFEPTSRRRALKRLSSRLPFRPTLRFIYMYVLRGGVLDGRAGYAYCRLLSLYEHMIVLKTRELRVRRSQT